MTTGTARERLAARQEEVLAALLRGDVPPGVDAAGAGLTTRVLHRKRSDGALRVVPELDELPGWRTAFHAWAAAHPADGCAHDDVRRFVAALRDGSVDVPTADDWLGLHDVHEGRRRVALVRLAGRRTLVVGLGSHLWRLTPRRRGGALLEGTGS
ncbi:hypothetical protein [Nocardioides alkalitolerans]|uniref:hypothetical protein n=1 Tax=Nocardioides alkalitolerans TaxID=281714 RepID=UPI0004092B78|nr:hypothetical protein [Nocardioides alkalitolerans]